MRDDVTLVLRLNHCNRKTDRQTCRKVLSKITSNAHTLLCVQILVIVRNLHVNKAGELTNGMIDGAEG